MPNAEIIDLNRERRIRQERKLKAAEASGKAIVFGNVEPVEAKILPFERKHE